MALANDNFWDYTTDIIYKYKVTYLEAAIAQPCWTSLLVCYVEGDYGHLFNEELHQQKYRTKVRGTAHSFALPWKEILAELERNCKEEDVAKNAEQIVQLAAKKATLEELNPRQDTRGKENKAVPLEEGEG